MAEAATTAGAVTAIASGAVGTVAATWLAMAGVDVPSLAAGMLGCVMVQTLLPEETINLRRIAAVTLGSMIFASMATPWVSPFVAHIAPSSVTMDQVRACSAALLAAFPKPFFLAAQKVIQKWAGKLDVV